MEEHRDRNRYVRRYLGCWKYRHLLAFGIDNSDFEMYAAQAVVRYMESHNGGRPPSWGDLVRNEKGPEFRNYSKRIWVKFDANPLSLASQAALSEEPTFHVIGAVDGVPSGFKAVIE